ncbi:MAG: hypothetical protein JWM88_1942, partial [Verrucomicrobia bacterium]|nr:hypothetical protein [Verrucomicrobiota bacterium]
SWMRVLDATGTSFYFPSVNSSRLLKTGIYSFSEASRLTGVSAARIRRWLKGYDFATKADRHHSNPVWKGQLEPIGGSLAVGFQDLIEIRFVAAFIDAGVTWKTMRAARRRRQPAARGVGANDSRG